VSVPGGADVPPETDPLGLNLVPGQISAVWTSLLTQLTEQGASRKDIMRVALDTASTVLQATRGRSPFRGGTDGTRWTFVRYTPGRPPPILGT
jgi:hypothetical protein